MSLPNDLPEEDFLHWVKATLGLQIAKLGSFSYIKRIMTKFINELKNIHPPDKEDHFDSLLYKVMFGGEIKLGKIKGVRSWMLYDQSCLECKEVISRMLDAFNDSKDCTSWTRHCDQESFKPELHWWIVSKLFISKKCKVDNAVCLKETDPFAVFSVMRNCKQFEQQVKHHAGFMIALRNDLMHSSNNTLTKEKLVESFDVIKGYLDVISKNNSNTSQEAEKDLDKAFEDLDVLEKKRLRLFDEKNNLQDSTYRALQTLQQCLRTDFGIPPDSDFKITTTLISRIEKKKCDNEKKQLSETLLRTSEMRCNWLKEDLKRAMDKIENYEFNYPQLVTVESPRHIVKPFTDAKFLKEIDIKIDSDKNSFSISDMCQMPDGTIIVTDYNNYRLKRLDDNCCVKDFYSFKKAPLRVVAISSSEVAVLVVPNVLLFIYINNFDNMSLKTEILLKRGFDKPLGMIHCNEHIWILDASGGIHIFRLSGELKMFLHIDIQDPKQPSRYPVGTFMTINADKTRVYVLQYNSVQIFDKYCHELLRFHLEGSWYLACITVSDADQLLIYDCRAKYVLMYKVIDHRLFHAGDLKLEEPNVPFFHPITFPNSIVYDKKNCCLIIYGQHKGCSVFQLTK